MFGELPSWAFYIRHVKGLSMKNIDLKVLEEDFRPAFVFDDVSGLKLEKVTIVPANQNNQIILRQVSDHSFDKIRIEGFPGKGIQTVE